MKVIGVIPARYASVRFPGKPLARLAGKTVIQRVYEQARRVAVLTEVIVATDDQRILNHVQSFGGQVLLTREDHPSGTDRVAEVVESGHPNAIIVNIQGDEPFVAPKQIETIVRAIQEGADIATLARPIETLAELEAPSVVKVVSDAQQRALYFSRHPIPFNRDLAKADWLTKGPYFQHLGLYAFRNATLQKLTKLPVGKLETSERLEQLRWLEAGYDIAVLPSQEASIGIDYPEDLERAERWLAKTKKHE